jgi:guanosine-3',5'-bis(diphosphate) 3'-pyrophosphohydrolase
MTVRELAIYVAGRYHQDQMYGESPYIYHLEKVDNVLKDVDFSELHPVRIASWLHDTIEDAGATQESLAKIFGPYVAQLVYSVSNEPGENRAERAKKTYPKIAALEDAIALKLADRIANVENSLTTFSKFGLMYLKEDLGFQKALFNDFPGDDRLVLLWERYFKAITNVKSKFGVKRGDTV